MLRGVLRVAVVFLLSAVPVFGQGAVAELNANVVGQTGSAPPGSSITITEEATGEAPIIEVTLGRSIPAQTASQARRTLL